MKLSETENSHGADVVVRKGVAGQEMLLRSCGIEFSLDQKTAAELLPILEHFIKTGKLPKQKRRTNHVR